MFLKENDSYIGFIIMKIATEELRHRIAEKGLKVTPQRVNILNAVYALDNHPTAEQVKDYIRKENPNIATGTVYKVLETFVENQLIRKVKTDRDILRYDGLVEQHHHLYCSTCDVIEDYVDKELDELLQNYFKNKLFDGFTVENIVLQIRGNFNKC